MVPQPAGDPGQQADQGPVRRLHDAAGGDRTGYLAGMGGGGDAPAGAGASGDERLQPGACFAWPQGDLGACCPQGADLPLGGEDVPGCGLHVEQGGLQQRCHHLLRDAGRGVLPRDAPPGDLVGRADRPGGEPEPVGEERPVRGQVLDHADFAGRGVGAVFPGGEDLLQVPGSHLGQPGGTGGGQLRKMSRISANSEYKLVELHRPGGARQLVGRDAPVEARIQVLPDGARVNGIGDGGEVDPGHLRGAGQEPADVPHVVSESRAVELVPGADDRRQHEGTGVDGTRQAGVPARWRDGVRPARAGPGRRRAWQC